MAADTPFDDADDPDERLRPPWEDLLDETARDRLPRQRPALHTGSAGDPLGGTDLPVLLSGLADAADALARLDARVAAADDAIHDGLLEAMEAIDRRLTARPALQINRHL